MKALTSRLRRIERDLGVHERDGNEWDYRDAHLAQRLSVLLLGLHPGIDLVERIDCDDEDVWLDIAADRAWRDGRFDEAVRLEKQRPEMIVKGDSVSARLNAVMETIGPRVEAFRVATQRAIERTGANIDPVALRW